MKDGPSVFERAVVVAERGDKLIVLETQPDNNSEL